MDLQSFLGVEISLLRVRCFVIFFAFSRKNVKNVNATQISQEFKVL